MKNSNKVANEGGINGTGKGIINTNSHDYKALQNAILTHANQQTKEERIGYHLTSLKYQMESYLTCKILKEIKTAGDFLREHIKAMGIKNKTFANFIDIEESNLSAIFKGKRKINTTLAYKLGLLFNINPNVWLNIQSKNAFLEISKKKSLDTKIYKLENLLKKVS